MKLLIITQKVDKNDSVLGFFHRWIEEFSKHCESVLVICLEKGEYNFPAHVQVISLGKEKHVFRLKYVLNFYYTIWKERKNYTAVFVHMNPEYVLLGGWIWRLLRKKIGLWYVHKQVNAKLRIAEKFVHFLFTVTNKSFQLKTKKIIFVGHGIDTLYFTPRNETSKNEKFTITSVGRITRIKKLEDLINSVEYFSDEMKKNMRVQFIGSPISEEDKTYEHELKELVEKKKNGIPLQFMGAVPFDSMRDVYWSADVCVNLAPTGGIDKTVLESFSCGVPTLFRNQAFLAVLGENVEKYFFQNEQALYEKIKALYENKIPFSKNKFHEMIRQSHDVRMLIPKIIQAYRLKK